MKSEDIVTWQAKVMRKNLEGSLRYLYRLMRRMEKKGFPPDDPLFVKVSAAYDAMLSLCVSLHYLSCSSGVWKPPKA